MLKIVAETVDEPSLEQSGATFDDFWTLWPRRMARKDAERAWNRLSERDRMAAVTALVDWRRVWMARGELQYVPYPATWLNGERWHDELPAGAVARPRSVPEPDLPRERAAMPQHVKDAIARLRGA